MAMRNSDSRLQSIGASFAVHFYTILVKTPEALASLYAPSAHVVHRFKKANGAAELSSLLTALTADGITSVKIDDVMTTPTTTGAIKVTVKGEFVSAGAAAQAFTQEVELRELENNTYAITSDRLTYAAAAAAGRTAWTAETPVLKAAAEPTPVPTPAAETKKEAAAAETAGESPAPAAAGAEAAAAKEEEAAAPAAAPAAEPVVPAKKPASFAEALRLKKVGDGAAFSNTAVRVTDKIKTAEPVNEKNDKTEKKDKKAKATAPAGAAAAAAGNGHKKREEKPNAPAASTAAPAKPKKPHTASGPVIFYDVILKELPESTTEEEVRGYVSPVAPVTLVNVVKSEKRRRAKEAAAAAPAASTAAAAETITFAFVQLERPADASATHVKDVVAKLSALHKDLRIEEVREKKPIAAGAKKPHAGAANGSAAAGPRKPREGAPTA